MAGATATAVNCLWGCLTPVRRTGEVCPHCLDEQVRRINRQIKMHSPPPGEEWGTERKRVIQRMATERGATIRQMDKLRQRYWKVVNKAIKLPPGVGDYVSKSASGSTG